MSGVAWLAADAGSRAASFGAGGMISGARAVGTDWGFSFPGPASWACARAANARKTARVSTDRILVLPFCDSGSGAAAAVTPAREPAMCRWEQVACQP